jgi:Mg-chelatase subunit ChlD
MKSKLQQARSAALAVLKTSNSQDEVALVTVGDEQRLALPFTSDSDKIADQLPSAAGEETALIDAIYLAMQVAHSGHNARKAIVVISDGGENNSRHSLKELRAYALE